MLGFLISPLARAALVGLAVAAAISFVALYLHSVKQSGVAQERAAESSRAAAAQARAVNEAQTADDTVARVSDPVEELRKRGWLVDAPKN